MRTIAKNKTSGEKIRNRRPVINCRASSEIQPLYLYSQKNVIRQRVQPCPCDGGCPRCAPMVQAKLKIGQPNDKYEQEADHVAEQVMRMPEPILQKKPG